MQEKGRRIISPEKQNKSRFGSGRLTVANEKALQKFLGWEKEHVKNQKFAIGLLFAYMFWLYIWIALRLITIMISKRSTQRLLWCGALLCMGIACLFYTKDNWDIVGFTNHAQSQISTDKEMIAKEQEKDVPNVTVLELQNADCKGWLRIPNTNIDYPIMQHLSDENYYLDKNFYLESDKNGCLILDNDSNLEQLGTNLIVHGHNMQSGEMFGNLLEYESESYGKDHNLLYLYTAEELRTYHLIAVFYSQVYYEDETVFKYYKYFGQGKEEFEEFYSNIKVLSLYDTGVEAIYGDEFLTLSTCSYHTENGRFVVVGKRIY